MMYYDIAETIQSSIVELYITAPYIRNKSIFHEWDTCRTEDQDRLAVYG